MESPYWKQNCLNINAADLCEKAVELREVGGFVANNRPTPYLCLVYKLVLINPPREIVEEMLHQPHFKYLTGVVALYIRLVYDAMSIYRLLEPLLADYRKLRLQIGQEVTLWHIDELIDALLQEERMFGIALPRIPTRSKLEDAGLELREPLIDIND